MDNFRPTAEFDRRGAIPSAVWPIPFPIRRSSRLEPTGALVVLTRHRRAKLPRVCLVLRKLENSLGNTLPVDDLDRPPNPALNITPAADQDVIVSDPMQG
jgi:hypothetical protein